MMTRTVKQHIKGKFDQLPKHLHPFTDDVVNEFLVSKHHKQIDGSVGTIKITPMQLKDLIAYTLAFGASLIKRQQTEAADTQQETK